MPKEKQKYMNLSTITKKIYNGEVRSLREGNKASIPEQPTLLSTASLCDKGSLIHLQLNI